MNSLINRYVSLKELSDMADHNVQLIEAVLSQLHQISCVQKQRATHEISRAFLLSTKHISMLADIKSQNVFDLI
jgi:hypothetical protein